MTETKKETRTPIGYIYETTNTVNNMKYIGAHLAETFDTEYYGSGTALKAALKEFGRKKFTVKIIEWCYDSEEIKNRERHHIAANDACKNENYYNKYLSSTITKLSPQTDEHRKKISESSKGKTCENAHNKDEDKIAKMAATHTGMTRSEETKKKISEVMSGKAPPNVGMKNYHDPYTGENFVSFENEIEPHWLPGHMMDEKRIALGLPKSSKEIKKERRILKGKEKRRLEREAKENESK